MNRPKLATFFAAGLVTLLIYLAPSIAQDADPADGEAAAQAEADEASEDEATEADEDAAGEDEAQPSADDVLRDLLRRRSDNPPIDPARPRSDDEAEDRSRAAEAIEGIAPGASEASLRREGQFVITRRGRMVRAPGDISGWVFVFEADGSAMSDPPMYLMPCQLLEDMEQIVQEHGDSVTFVLSGQIYLYRGANYLMPTLMKLAPDRGNIDP